MSVNALYPFNVWNEERARQTEALAGLAAAANATGLVMCPLNEGRMLEDTPEKAAALRAALTAIRPILEAHNLKGFVEPLGFPVSSLRSKAYALAATDDIGGAGDSPLGTTRSIIAARARSPCSAARTGLVHISGLEDPAISFADMLDGHRVLVGPKDRLGNVEQLRRLYAPTATTASVLVRAVREGGARVSDPIAAVRDSMAYLREAELAFCRPPLAETIKPWGEIMWSDYASADFTVVVK